jgi:hypothetical protein
MADGSTAATSRWQAQPLHTGFNRFDARSWPSGERTKAQSQVGHVST